MILRAALSVMLGFPLLSAAQETASQATVATKVDFSGGFQRLIALGLPSLDGAVWTSTGENRFSIDDYELRETLSGLSGGGWKIQENGKPVILALGAVKSEEITASGGNERGGGLLGALFGGGPKKPKAVDLVADANSLIATLDDAEKSKELRSRLEYGGAGVLGRLLIFAAQLHQSGHPVEAGRLANSLFNLGARPEAVIDAAINRLASRDLSIVTESFFTSKDWAAYERDLRALTERYPRGWEANPAVQMLLPAVTKRVAGGMPAKPTIEGAAINPEAIAALDEVLQDGKGTPDEDAVNRYAKQSGIPLSQLTPQLRMRIAEMLTHSEERGSSGAWLIDGSSNGESKDPWSKLKRLGLEALPALAAVANDDTLTFSRNASSSRSSYRSGRESAAEIALAAYQSMDRPLSRGELACRMLASALPGESNEESNPQSLAESAMEFWKAHRRKSNLDLLLVFLSEGDSSQKQTAAISLASMPEEPAHAAFEKYVLESEEIASTMDSVVPYLKLRKTAAKDFFDRFSKALKAQLEGVDLEQISGGYDIKNAGGVDKYLKKLSLFVSGESPRKLVLELAKAEKPNVKQIDSLASTVEESSPDQFIPLFLEGAVMAKHVETRSAFLSVIGQGSANASEPDSEVKDTPVPQALIPNWKILLEDTRPTAGDEQIRQLAAQALEDLYSPGTLEQTYELGQLDSLASSELILNRAMERVAGKSPTPFPTADKVTAARMDEMLKQLAAAKPEAVHDLAKSWQLGEKLAYLKWRSDPGNTSKIPASVITARTLLTAPDVAVSSPELPKVNEVMQSLQLKIGDKIDFERITTLVKALTLDAKKNSGLVVSFTTTPLDTGLAFSAIRLFDRAGKSDVYEYYYLSGARAQLEEKSTEAAVGIMWPSDGNRANTYWKIDGKTVTPPDAAVLEKFRESLTTTDTTEARRLNIILTVLHRDDIEKLNKLNASDNEDETEDETEDSVTLPGLPLDQ